MLFCGGRIFKLYLLVCFCLSIIVTTFYWNIYYISPKKFPKHFESLKSSQVFGKHITPYGPNLGCFERRYRLFFNQTSSCFAEKACAISNTTFSVPEFQSPILNLPLKIEDGSPQQFIFEQSRQKSIYSSEFAFIGAPFAMYNSFHNVIDQKATLFSMMYSLGMYSLRTLTLSNNNLEFYFPFQGVASHPGGKQTMDAIFDYLTTKPVNYTYRMPQKGHCMSRVDG
jgi:hypothetical protein